MIKNIILDVGMVLVDFCWADLLHQLGITGEAFEAVADATVRTQTWNEYDRSTKTEEELLADLKANAPQYAQQIQLFWDNMSGMIRQYPYAKPWITALKESGYRVYILSNYSNYKKQHGLLKPYYFLTLINFKCHIFYSRICLFDFIKHIF